MIVYAVAVIVGIMLGATVFAGLYRRRRARPSVYQVAMAKHFWRPRKLK
jgi:hypothetical protein